MRSTDLTEQERVALEVIEALGDDAAPTMIHMVIRAQFRERATATLRSLRERGLLLRYSLGQYTLTPPGGAPEQPPGNGDLKLWRPRLLSRFGLAYRR